jgi:hypothetical protein
MDHVRGLAPKTRSTAVRIVGRLLASRFGDSTIDITALKLDHVQRFFAQQAKLYTKPANAAIRAGRGHTAPHAGYAQGALANLGCGHAPCSGTVTVR